MVKGPDNQESLLSCIEKVQTAGSNQKNRKLIIDPDPKFRVLTPIVDKKKEKQQKYCNSYFRGRISGLVSVSNQKNRKLGVDNDPELRVPTPTIWIIGLKY